jgi:hypothetical protein
MGQIKVFTAIARELLVDVGVSPDSIDAEVPEQDNDDGQR